MTPNNTLLFNRYLSSTIIIMAFEGYEIPSSIGVPRMDLPVIEKISVPYGESPEQYMLGSMGLVAVWREMVDMIGFTPGLMHGIANPAANELELFSIDDLIGMIGPKIQERKLISAELCFDISPEDILTFEVPEVLHPRIIKACVYFDHGPKSLIGVAAEIRDIVLSGQNNGLIYVFGVDGDNWYDVVLDTITGDPEELSILTEADDQD